MSGLEETKLFWDYPLASDHFDMGQRVFKNPMKLNTGGISRRENRHVGDKIIRSSSLRSQKTGIDSRAIKYLD